MQDDLFDNQLDAGPSSPPIRDAIGTLHASMIRRRTSVAQARPGIATVRVARSDLSSEMQRYSGSVRIDGEFVGNLVGGRPRAFLVPTGLRHIEVGFGANMEVETTVSLLEDETAEFACEVRDEFRRLSRQRDKSLSLSLAILFLPLLIWFLVVWSCTWPREAAAWLCLRCGLEGTSRRFVGVLTNPLTPLVVFEIGLLIGLTVLPHYVSRNRPIGKALHLTRKRFTESRASD